MEWRRLCVDNWFRLRACSSPEKEEIGNPLGENRDRNTGREIQKYWAEIQKYRGRNTEAIGQKYRDNGAEIQKKWDINTKNADTCSQRKRDLVVKRKERVIQRGKLSIIAKFKFTFFETENGDKGKYFEF